MQLTFKPYNLQLNSVFRISRGSRNSAPLILVKLSFEGVDGYGEGSMPPLYGESTETALKFLSKVDLSSFKNPFETETILNYINNVAPGNQAVKCALDIALHDLVGNLLKIPARNLFGLSVSNHYTSMTIGIDTPEAMAQKAIGYKSFKYLKIKLGLDNDKEIIEAIRKVSDQPLFIDANQGWRDKEAALDFIYWLKEQNTVFIEQPMLKEDKAGNAWLTERSPLPIIADEGFQRLTDLREVSGIYHGINIKLMKSTGLREGFKMAVTAKALGMKVMLGCMTETSCAISAAAQLGALADWVDLDGNLDVKNDPYKGITVENGQLILKDTPGIGLQNPDWESIPQFNY